MPHAGKPCRFRCFTAYPFGMLEFLQALFESGHVSVSMAFELEEKEDLSAMIRDFDRAARLNLPGMAPKLDPVVARWAATLLYRGCQLVALRNIDASQIAGALRVSSPAARSPETD